MVCASVCRETFERLIRLKYVVTPIGRRRIYSFHIRVYSGRSTSVVCLEANVGFPFTLEKTYPMSPRNAYRLVVSL